MFCKKCVERCRVGLTVSLDMWEKMRRRYVDFDIVPMKGPSKTKPSIKTRKKPVSNYPGRIPPGCWFSAQGGYHLGRCAQNSNTSRDTSRERGRAGSNTSRERGRAGSRTWWFEYVSRTWTSTLVERRAPSDVSRTSPSHAVTHTPVVYGLYPCRSPSVRLNRRLD